MAFTKTHKVDQENYQFKSDWTNDFNLIFIGPHQCLTNKLDMNADCGCQQSRNNSSTLCKLVGFMPATLQNPIIIHTT